MSRRRLDQLERLGRLRQSGVLTPIEYESEKRRLLESSNGFGFLPVSIIGLLALIAGRYLAIRQLPHWLSAAPSKESPRSIQTTSANSMIVPGQHPAPIFPTTPSSPNLNALLAFSDPRTCGFGPRLTSLYDAMARWSDKADKMVGGGNIRIPELHGSIHSSFRRTPNADGTVEYMALLPLKGTWFGLRVTGLSTGGFERSDQFAWDIRFDEAPTRVRSVLNDHGFGLPAVGKYRSVAEGERADAIVPHGTGAALICTPNL